MYYRCAMKVAGTELGTEEACFVVAYDVTKRDILCCVCAGLLVVASVLFKHPTAPMAYQKLKYCHRMCYNEARSPQRARFPGRCPNCRNSLEIGDAIEPHDGGRLWRHMGCTASTEFTPPNALVNQQLAASAVLCVDDGDFDLSSAATLSFEQAPAPKRAKTRAAQSSSTTSSQDTGVTDALTQDSDK
jgi:hypothetical protein